MNWRKVLLYAAVLAIAQILVGFMEGFLLAPITAGAAIAVSAGSFLLSLVCCSAIIAHLALNQSVRPRVHAILAVVIQLVVSALVWQVTAALREPVSPVLPTLELLQLLLSLCIGLVIAGLLPSRRSAKADA